MQVSAEIFTKTIENQFTTTECTDFTNEILRETNEQHNNDVYLLKKHLLLSWNKIKKMPNKKTLGPDEMSNACLKHTDKKVALLLTQIYNSCSHAKYLPNKWKHATGGKNLREPSNYRLITLSDILVKLFESILLDKLTTLMPKLESVSFDS